MLDQSRLQQLLAAFTNAVDRILAVISQKVGDLTALSTSAKEDSVSAINELYAKRYEGVVTTPVTFAVDTTIVLSTLVAGFVTPASLTLVAGNTFISLTASNEMKIFTVQAAGDPLVTSTLDPRNLNMVSVSKVYSLTSPTSLSGTLLATPAAFVRLAYDTGRGIYVRSLLPVNTSSVHVNNLVGGLLPTPLADLLPDVTLATVNTFGNGVVHLNRLNIVTGTAAEFGIDTDEVSPESILAGTVIRTPVTGTAHHWNFEVFVSGRKVYRSVRGDLPDPENPLLATVTPWTDYSDDMDTLLVQLTDMFNNA